MKKNYFILVSAWITSVILSVGIIMLLQHFGILPNFAPQTAKALTGCRVDSDLEISGGLSFLVYPRNTSLCPSSTCSGSNTGHDWSLCEDGCYLVGISEDVFGNFDRGNMGAICRGFNPSTACAPFFRDKTYY